MPTLTEQYDALKQQEARAQRLRTEAETLQRVAHQRLESIDAEIRAHGVDPEKVEQEISTLETALTAEMAKLSSEIAETTAAYEQIIAAARAAGLQA